MKASNDNAAKIIGIMGASGCGKTHYLRAQLAKKKRRRTLIWSPKEAVDNYASFYPNSVVVRSAGEVINIMREAGKSKEFHIVFRPRLNRKIDAAQFNVVCKAAMVSEPLTFIAEELHTVTLPSWSPDGWGELTMMGRGYGHEVFGLSQRPASVDKDFFGNLSLLHVGRMAFDDDAKAVAKALRVPAAQVMDLSGFGWIEPDMLNGKVTDSP